MNQEIAAADEGTPMQPPGPATVAGEIEPTEEQAARATEAALRSEAGAEASALDELFTYHPPGPVEEAKYIAIRSAAKALALVIETCCESGPDRTAAIRKIREAVMTANASIATRNAAARMNRN